MVIVYLQIINKHLDFSTENYLRQMATGYSETAGPEVLRVDHIFGPLVMLGIGVIAASLAFAGEHVFNRIHLNKARIEKETAEIDVESIFANGSEYMP